MPIDERAPHLRATAYAPRAEFRTEETASNVPAGALALVGAWADVPESEIDASLEEIARSRSSDTGRPVVLEP